MRYDDEGFEYLPDIEGWSPYYVADYATADEILETLFGHGHDGHGHDHDEHDEYDYDAHDHDYDDAVLDEHVWTSPENAKQIVQQIADVLASLDPSRADLFAQNTAAYASELDALDQAFQHVVDAAARKAIVFGDRFPFRYLADAIAESTGAIKLELHATHNITKSDFGKDVSYLELMWQNMEKLEEALN
jgi:zinc transport system substrate-binding protein